LISRVGELLVQIAYLALKLQALLGIALGEFLQLALITQR
jgi:hypothetical protein